MKKIRLDLAIILFFLFALGGLWVGCQGKKENLAEQQKKIALEFLKKVEKSSGGEARTPAKIDSSTAKKYIDKLAYFVKEAHKDPEIHDRLFRILSKSRSMRIDFDSLAKIRKGRSYVKYIYFYPAINDDDYSLTLIAVGAERYKDSAGKDTVRLLLRSTLPRIPGAPSTAKSYEIWDNMSPCPDNCPTNGF